MLEILPSWYPIPEIVISRQHSKDIMIYNINRFVKDSHIVTDLNISVASTLGVESEIVDHKHLKINIPDTNKSFEMQNNSPGYPSVFLTLTSRDINFSLVNIVPIRLIP